MAEYTIDKIEYGDNVYNLSPNVVYATCSTAASTAAKVATITSGTLNSLNTGDQVIVKFTYANGKASPTLKVGSTDAKSIMRYGTTAPSTSAATSWNAGSCVWFVYDGTYWQMAGWINSTYTVTDKKLEIGAVTSGTTYYPIVGNGTTAATRQYDSTGFEYAVYTGTTETQGGAGIRLGNSTATGTAGNKKGFITIYGTGSNSSTLYGPSSGTSSYNVWLPDNGGILALTTDIPDVSGKIDTAGTGLSKSGTTLNHSNSVTAQTTQAVYPIKIDAQGHISAYGSAVTIPTVPANIVNTITTTAGTHTAITSQKGNVSFNVPTKTSHLTNDSGFITSAGVTSITTTAGTHTTISSSTGAVSFNVPTKTSHLTNDSGFITSYTDEKLKWTASTTTNTYYPLVSTSTATTSTANTLNGINFYQYYNTAGGYRRLELGNATANQSTGGAYGTIRLFGANATYYGDLVPGNPELGSGITGAGLSGNRIWKIPDKSGTIALTSDVVPKPSDDGSFGWVLKYSTNGASFWDPPSGFRFAIQEDSESPGTYSFDGIEPGSVQETWMSSTTSLVLELRLLNATNSYDIYTLTDYYVQEVPTNDGCYYVLWFTDIFRVIGDNQKKITVGIYLDELEIEHEYGEITVDVREIGERYTINGGDTDYTSNIQTSADQFKQLAVLNLPAGTWIVTARARFAPTSSSNHYSAINIGTTTAGSGSTTTGNAIRDRRYGEGTYFNQHALTRIISLAVDMPVYLNGGGSNVAGTWNRTNDVFQFDAVRIS